MNFIYYAYIGICSLRDGFDLNKSLHPGATTPPTATWTHRHTSVSDPTWLDDIYLHPSHLDTYEHPRFAESGLVTRPHGPTLSGVDPPATTAPLNITLGREQRSQWHTLMSIIFYTSPHLSGLSLWPHLPVSDCHPTPITHLPMPPTVCPSHRYTMNLMGSSSHQNQFGRDTSNFPSTHYLSPTKIGFSHSLQVTKKSVSHSRPRFNHKSHLYPNRKTFPILITPSLSMLPRSTKPTQKPPPEVAAPYPPFGRHPSDPLGTLRAPYIATDLSPLPLSTKTKISICSKSASTPRAMKSHPRGRSAAPTKATYPIFANNASTTTTSSLTLASSSIAPSQHQSNTLTGLVPFSLPAPASTINFPPIPSGPCAKGSTAPSFAAIPYIKASKARRGSCVADLLTREKAANIAHYTLDLKEVRCQ